MPGCVASITIVPEVLVWAGIVSVEVDVAPLTVLAEKLPVMVLDLSTVKTIGLSDPPPVAIMGSVTPPAM